MQFRFINLRHLVHFSKPNPKGSYFAYVNNRGSVNPGFSYHGCPVYPRFMPNFSVPGKLSKYTMLKPMKEPKMFKDPWKGLYLEDCPRPDFTQDQNPKNKK